MGKKEKKLLEEFNSDVDDLLKTARKFRKERKRAITKQIKEQSKIERIQLRHEKSRLANWFTLDNAAIIYPSIREENWDFVFRVSALMKAPIDKEILQQAVDEIKPRFPSFFVSLKSGFFWNYFEENHRRLIVEEENKFPCFKFPRKGSGHLIRVLYYNNRISLECFHALADGRSAVKFLNSIVKHYLELLGVIFDEEKGTLNYLDKPKREELLDSFSEYCNNTKRLKHKEIKAYKIRGNEEEFGVVNSTIGIMSVSQLKEVAKSYNAKLFEFILSVLAEGLINRAKKEGRTKRPVKISVPVDLRQFFESESLRNFSGYLNIEFKVRDYEFNEIVSIVKSELAKITKEHMQGFINSNVSMQKNYLIKLVPLFIKNFVIKLCFKVWGEVYQTIAVSNVGMNSVPEEFSQYVDRFEVNLGRPKYNAKSIGLISYGDKLVFTFSSKIKENTIEKDFYTGLSKRGVNLTIETNRRDLYE